MKLPKICVLVIAVCALSVSSLGAEIVSPDGDLKLSAGVSDGRPFYKLTFKNQVVVEESNLGFVLLGGADLTKDLELVGTSTYETNSTWKPVWGEVSTITDRHNQLLLEFRQKSGDKPIRMNVRFRLFDDGLGFRYEFPDPNGARFSYEPPVPDGLKYFQITDEVTQFRLTGDHKAFWIPGDFDTNEYPYTESRLSEIDAEKVSKVAVSISTRKNYSPSAVQTPLMLKTDKGLYINIHEAALINYPGMNLNLNRDNFDFEVELAPNTVGSKAFMQTPANTPWRTILVSDDARDILASKTILNLNEPSKLEKTDWIKPQKFVGIWWELHVGKSTWNYSDVNNVKLGETDFSKLKPNGKHGATTENAKRYIDFAAEHGIDSVLIEGWNVGWEDWFGQWKLNVFDFVTPYPDFDVKAVNEYAASKGVKIMMHHETSASVTNYERRLERSFQFMKDNGNDSVKTGYVGKIIPRGELHDGQYMVNHYNHVAERAAEYGIMVNSHESVRLTGLHRTYPNWVAAEAARGNEFNAWSEGNAPFHETVLPFTRLMGGPMDYTPGIFETQMNHYDPSKKEKVKTTLVKQLALYVTLYSPLQMVADLPENYEKHMDAFQFIKDVGVDWSDTKIIAAEPGDYIVIARKKKGTDKWFVGAITDENPRMIRVPLDFLDRGKVYDGRQYLDGKDAHWEKNPKSYRIVEGKVKSDAVLNLQLAPGGGAAISLMPQ